MAEQNLHIPPNNNTVTEDRIQSLVRGIVGEILSPQERNNETQQFLSAENAINCRFRLPRGRSTSTTAECSSSGSSSQLPGNNMNAGPVPSFNPRVNYGLRRQRLSAPGPSRQRGHRQRSSSNLSRPN